MDTSKRPDTRYDPESPPLEARLISRAQVTDTPGDQQHMERLSIVVPFPAIQQFKEAILGQCERSQSFQPSTLQELHETLKGFEELRSAPSSNQQ